MQKFAVPVLKRYSKRKGSLLFNPEINRILKDKTTKPLDHISNNKLRTYFLDKSKRNELLPEERKCVLYFLNSHQDFKNIASLGKQLIFLKPETFTHGRYGVIRQDINLKELKCFLYSLIQTGQLVALDDVVTEIIAQYSVKFKNRLYSLIKFLTYELISMSKLENNKVNDQEIFVKWVKWVKLMTGTCEITDFLAHKEILKPFRNYLRELGTSKNYPNKIVEILDSVKYTSGKNACSQTATTVMYLLYYWKLFPCIKSVWDYKVTNQLPIAGIDLTNIMRFYNSSGQYDLVKKVYEEHQNAQTDEIQFDYLLIAHEKIKDWTALRQQFDALFGIGKLPNIRHYEIMMFSLAGEIEVKSVENLFAQLLRRGMIPTYRILESLLYVYYKSNKLMNCFELFPSFEKYSVKPTAKTYEIMFKVYKNLSDIEGALKLLKHLTEEKRSLINESHLSILIQTCSKFTNHLIAKEIFTIMMEHYSITPTPLSISALMEVYIESGLPAEALLLFNRYKNNKNFGDSITAIYTKAIKANMVLGHYIKCDNLINEVMGNDYKTDSKFYETLIEYTAVARKDPTAAEAILEQLLNHPRLKANTAHFEIMMSTYDHISYFDGIFHLYKEMTSLNIPLSSKILYFLVKATFKVQMKNKGDLSTSIELVYKIMENISQGNLYMTNYSFHPSAVGWAIRTVAKHYNPKVALGILNRYNELFYNSDRQQLNKKFVLMRTLVTLFAELREWNNFEMVFDNMLKQLTRYEKLPSATVQNKKLRSLFVGIFPYKIQQLVSIGQIEKLPPLLDMLQEKNLVLDNVSWNEAVMALFNNPETITIGLRIANEKLIHGYNLIHKYRLLSRLAVEMPAKKETSLLLKVRKEDPKSFKPTLYLKSDTLIRVTEYLDDHLNNTKDLENMLKVFIKDYPYFMKSYLMKPRLNVKNWSLIELNHSKYLKKLRSTKRIVSCTEF